MKVNKPLFKPLLLTLILVFIIGISGVSAVGTYPSVDPNMVLYYNFNNDSSVGENYTLANSNVYDYSGSGNNGTTQGNMTWNSTGGYLGDGAFNFNGSQYINSSLNYNTSTPFSFCLWAKYGNVDTQSYLVTDRSGGDAFVVELASSRLRFSYWNKEGVAKNDYMSDALSINTWYYICATFNGTQINLYNQGYNYRNIYYTNITDGTGSLRLGFGTVAGRYFNGSLDDFVLYNRTLTSTEVFNNYDGYFGCNITNQYILGGNKTLCNQTYYFNSSGNSGGQGALVIGSSDIVIDGNGSYFIGNGTGVGISANGYKNITLKNFNFINYSRIIFVQNGYYYNISNVNLNGSDTNGILYRNISNSSIDKSIIYGGSSSTNLIYLDSGSSFNNIYNNILFNGSTNIYVLDNSSNNKIYNNFLNNSIISSLINLASADNNTIFNNTILNSGWNGIISYANYTNISLNYINNPHHNGIDKLSGGSYNSIYNNTISNLYGSLAFPLAIGILLKHADNNYVFYNNITNCGIGSDVEGNTTRSFNNSIYNNTITNCTYGFDVSSNSSVFTDNQLNNIGQYHLYLNGYFNDSSIFYNTLTNNNIFKIYLINNSIKTKIYDLNNYPITFINGSSDLNSNNNINLFNLSSPLISFSNGTSLYQSGTNLQYDLTLLPLQSVTIRENVTYYKINYNYNFNQNDQNTFRGSTTFITSGILGMVINFFSLAPVIGTILAVCILVAIILILILYVKRMKNSGDSDTIYG